MRAARRGWRLGFLAALAVGAGGCSLNAAGQSPGDEGDVWPDGFDGEVPPRDDARDDSREDARDETADDAEAAQCLIDDDCDDGVACTVDTCTPGAGTCAFEPSAALCEDDDACTGQESCDPVSGCVAGTPVGCADDLSCTDDLCDPSTGACSWSSIHTRCTSPQLCDPPRATDATGCADPPTCTTDLDCSDDDLCNGTETCGPDLLCRTGDPVHCDDGVVCTTDSCAPATGACSFLPPDADGDTFADASCSGTDCDDAEPGIHPGATEICNGIDDNCNLLPDDGASCTALPHSMVQCIGGSCVMTCTSGWDNCDGIRSNGCESSLVDPATCGSCDTPCVLDNAVETCATGVCAIGSCESGWGDCDSAAATGCERPLNTLTDCGACRSPCNPTNVVGPDCSGGTCGYASCATGWLDCDARLENGCELSVGTSTSCGTACGTVTNCTALPNVLNTTCTGGACAISDCANGYSECNDLIADGCERLLNNNLGACGDNNIGSVSGDSSSTPLTVTRWGEGWLAFRVTENNDSSMEELTATITLDVPPGINYDIYVRCGGSGCGSSGPNGTAGSGIDETVNLRWEDVAFSDVSRTIYVEIRYASGSTLDCGAWTFTVTGDTAVGSTTCP